MIELVKKVKKVKNISGDSTSGKGDLQQRGIIPLSFFSFFSLVLKITHRGVS